MNNFKKNKPRRHGSTYIRTAAQRMADEEKKRALEAERENARAHRRRVNSASSRRAMPASFTRGYYRFAKEYPTAVNENGDRLNEPIRREKLTPQGMTAFIAALVLIFSLGYVLTDAAIDISDRKTLTQPLTQEQPDVPDVEPVHAIQIDPLLTSAVQAAQVCRENNCTAVCFDYKNDYGYTQFLSQAAAGDSAKNASLDLSETVSALHGENLKVIVRLSCFLDTAACNANSSWAALTGEGGGIWYDSQSDAWLNPYSAEAVDYLNTLACEIAAGGADYILLDNVSYSPQTRSGNAFYPGERTSSLTQNSVLRQFVDTLAEAVSGDKLILSCRVQGFTGNYGETYSFYGGNLLGTPAQYTACDMRLSKQSPALRIGSAYFENAAEIPYVFVLTAGEYAVSATESSSSLFAVLERSSTTANQLNAVSAAGISNYIIMN